MLSEGPVAIRQIIRFLMLPYCYLTTINWKICSRSKVGVAYDFLYCFFVLRNYPDNYGPCRLWEVPRLSWAQYYGSPYNPHQRSRLRKEVHPLLLERAFSDKEVVDGLSRRMNLAVPHTVGVIEATGLTDVGAQSLLAKSKSGKRLIVKPVHGHAGIGIAILERIDSGVIIRTKNGMISPKDFAPGERCVVQEMVIQRQDLAHIASGSLNTVRLLTMLTKSDEFLVLGAYMRFGRSDSYVDNLSAGGLAVGIDLASGALMGVGYDRAGRTFDRHPDSGVIFEGVVLEDWNDLIEFGERVHRSFPFFRILGLDIAFSTEGIILIETNNSPDLADMELVVGPLLGNQRVWQSFNDYQLLYNQRQLKIPYIERFPTTP